MKMEYAADTEEQIRRIEWRIKSFVADVTDIPSIQRAADEIEEWTDSIDILLYAPGVNSSTPFLELEMEEWDKIMAVNLRGLVATNQILLKDD